jgi:frataxin
MAADESSFAIHADQALARLAEAIDQALGDRLDVDLTGGVLTIDLETGGQYVINKHAPSRQIWMSSPRSGATHFDYRDQVGWVAAKTGAVLEKMLAEELSVASGTPIALG